MSHYITLEAVGAGVQETLMESDNIAWADTCDGAAFKNAIQIMGIGKFETF